MGEFIVAKLLKVKNRVSERSCGNGAERAFLKPGFGSVGVRR